MLKIATVFSGIGAFEESLIKLGIDFETAFACDNGERLIEQSKEEILSYAMENNFKNKELNDYVNTLYDKNKKPNMMKKSYFANYKIKDDEWYEDIRFIDGNQYKNKVDIFVGGSPCQSFSSVGFQKGLDDARGTLFYEFARLIKEIQPKVFIYENVRNLINHNNGETWKVIKGIFSSLGYKFKFDVLNACDYGIPQTRRRLFVIGFKENFEFEFPPKRVQLKYIMKDFSLNNCAEGQFLSDNKGNLIVNKVSGKVDSKYTLSPKLYNYVMKGGTKTFYQKPIINMDIARTLLKTMGNRHRAGIDNYLSFDGTENLGSVRMLSEREALRLMGYTDDFKIVVSRCQAYKQAGNSIVVDVMIAILNNILDTGVFDCEEGESE